MLGNLRTRWLNAKPRTRVIIAALGVVFALCTLGQLAGNDNAAAPATPAAAPAVSLATTTTDATPTNDTPALTVAQQNATEAARRYLNVTPFSRSGLIGQLGYEGYSEADATLAVDSLGVDWTAQADRKAAQYLAMTPFSRSGLIEQLMFEGFSREQAEHGASAVGL